MLGANGATLALGYAAKSRDSDWESMSTDSDHTAPQVMCSDRCQCATDMCDR